MSLTSTARLFFGALTIALFLGGCATENASTPEDIAAAAEVEPGCIPQCDELSCGDDGCGGSCGSCFNAGGGLAPELCMADGTCCEQQCDGKLCGGDGCGGSCGKCAEFGECVEGGCVYTPGWTVLIYALGDNDLEGSMLAQFNQLMTVGSNENLNIVVQMDYVEGMNGRPGNWKEKDLVAGQRLLINKDEIVVLEEMEEFDSADPDVLAEFIQWGVTNYPARRYALILDDHGGGYTGIGSDWTNQSWMPLPAIAQGLADGLAGVELARFDFLFFYACLMGNWEVAHQMEPYTQYLLASEELAIGAAFRLDRIQIAHDDGNVPADTLAWALAEDYVPTWTKAYPDVTISLLDLDQLPAFELALADFLNVLGKDLANYAGSLMAARHNSEQFASLPFGFSSMHLLDLGQLFNDLVALRPELGPAASATLAAYDKLVAFNDAGPGHSGATGMSVFFPPSDDYYNKENPYNGSSPALEYAKAGPPQLWMDFLAKVFETLTIAEMGPIFGCFEGDDREICKDQSGWYVEDKEYFSLSRPLLTENLSDDFQASFVFAALPSYGMGQIDFYNQFPVEIDQQTGMVSATYDYRRLVLHQGDKKSFANWRLEPMGSDQLLTVPFSYLVPGSEQLETVEWRATVDSESWTVLNSTWFIRNASGLFEETKLSGDAKLYPAVKRLDMQWHTYRWEPLFTFFAADQEITLSFEPLEACQAYLYGLVVEDSVGRSDLLFANVCKADGEPKLKITVTVEADAEVLWDPSNAPDFAITLGLQGEDVKFEPVADSQKAVFELVIDYTRWMSASLEVREVDGNYHKEILSRNITNRLYYADWFCGNGKKWTLQDVKDGPKTTIHLNISKCF
jgi:hypothetical protein